MLNKMERQNNKTKQIMMFAVIGILILAVAGIALAVRYEDNNFKYGEVDSSGNSVLTTTPIENVSIRGYICTDADCSGVSGTIWNGDVLQSVGDYIQLIYPTNLLSAFGYGVYMYKNGYIPYEVNADWWGTCATCDPLGPFDNYLSKKQICIVNINNMDADISGGNIDVDVNIQSPIEHAGPLDYVPPEIKEQYEVNVDVNLEVTKNNTLFYQETKNLDLLYSSDEDVDFSFPTAGAGEYNVYVYTETNDAKCIAYNKDKENKTIIILENCTDADHDSYNVTGGNCGPIDCDDTNPLIHTGAPEVCTNGVDDDCDGLIDCADSDCFGHASCTVTCYNNTQCGIPTCSENDNYCNGGNLWHDYTTYTCNNPGLVTSSCSNSTSPAKIADCVYDCQSKMCVSP